MTTLSEISGVITSPFYPRSGHHYDNQSCSWEIRARKGKRISLTIEDMDFEDMDIDSSGDWACGEGWSCSCGYLEIQGGSISGYDGPKWRLCSVPLTANATYVWFKERIKVLFVSDSTIGWDSRFKISYTQVPFDVSGKEILLISCCGSENDKTLSQARIHLSLRIQLIIWVGLTLHFL